MAVAIAWLPGPAGTRRRVAKPSVEEPDAAEPARPDLWGPGSATTLVYPTAKAMLYDIWMAETQPAADRAFDLFLATFAAKFPAATTCLAKNRDVRLTFYAFPAEHWIHIRTTNPVESTFATVRLRTKKTKGAGSRVACLTMVFKLAMAAQKHWRALNGSQLIADVIDGVPFVDGVRKEAA